MSDVADAEDAGHPPVYPPGFSVTVSELAEGVVTVGVSGAVDLLTAPPMDEALQRAQQDAGAVQLDLRGVDFLGSAGLSVLVDAARRADEAGGRLAILASGHTVRRAVQVTGLDAVLQIFDDPDEADSFLRG